MKVPHLHRWPREVASAKALQEWLVGSLDLTPTFQLSEGMLVAGVDVSYERRAVDCHAVIAALRWPEWELIETGIATLPSPVPYVPGYLSFREGPVVLKALESLRCEPDLFIVDSHGTAHPRRFGSASHLGLWFGRPTIGCAKSRLCGEHREPALKRGSAVPLRDAGEQIGWVLRSRDRVKPIYVSPGHLISMDSALSAVKVLLGRYRILEPIRAAHRLSNEVRLATGSSQWPGRVP